MGDRDLATGSSTPTASVQDELRSIAAALTTARGRLHALASSLSQENPKDEREESGPGLRSILSCILTDALDIAIRDLGRAAEQEGAAAEYAAGQDVLGGQVYAAVIARIHSALPHLLAQHERQQQEAEELFVDLASSEGAERAAALADERFHRTLVIEKLLEESGSALPEDPTRAEEFAGLATAVAGHLTGAIEAMEGRARAACRVANARRLAGDLAGAERALAKALPWVFLRSKAPTKRGTGMTHALSNPLALGRRIRQLRRDRGCRGEAGHLGPYLGLAILVSERLRPRCRALVGPDL